MPRIKLDFDAQKFETVRKLALALPGVEDASAYGSPAFKLNGKLLACIAINKSAEPNTLAVRIDFDGRAELLAEAPDVYYVTDHYVDYPVVLVRLARVDAATLSDLLHGAWRFVGAKSARKAARSKPVRSKKAPAR